MSAKIFKTLDVVIEESNVRKDIAEFLRTIIDFECYESTFRYKSKYREELDKRVKANGKKA